MKIVKLVTINLLVFFFLLFLLELGFRLFWKMGTLEKEGTRWALIRTADGTLHRTSKGHHVGDNNGEIIAISENQIQLREIVPDGLGGWVERFTTLSTDE